MMVVAAPRWCRAAEVAPSWRVYAMATPRQCTATEQAPRQRDIVEAAPQRCTDKELAPRRPTIAEAAARWCTAAELMPHWRMIVTAALRWCTTTELAPCRHGVALPLSWCHAGARLWRQHHGGAILREETWAGGVRKVCITIHRFSGLHVAVARLCGGAFCAAATIVEVLSLVPICQKLRGWRGVWH